jgi:hypothetical protein
LNGEPHASGDRPASAVEIFITKVSSLFDQETSTSACCFPLAEAEDPD